MNTFKQFSKARIILLASVASILGSIIAVSGVRCWFATNWSSDERISTSVSVWNENISSALSAVNTRQSLIMEAASATGIDARVLGASIMARRVLGVEPMLQQWREITGNAAVEIGFAQVSVQSTEAALRVVFYPSLEDSLLYYPHTLRATEENNNAGENTKHKEQNSRWKTAKNAEGYAEDYYAEVRRTLAPYSRLSGNELHAALRHDERLSAYTAALLLKQAFVRLLNEEYYNRCNTQTVEAHHISAMQMGHAAQQQTSKSDAQILLALVGAISRHEEAGGVASLLYRRDDVLP